VRQRHVVLGVRPKRPNPSIRPARKLLLPVGGRERLDFDVFHCEERTRRHDADI
jgi:hypothetical protein